MYTVELRPEVPAPRFHPGQFLHLTVDAYDPSGFWPESRVFSIASSPNERDRLSVCYSVKGAYTRLMEQTLRVGGEVWVKLPYGEFMIDPACETVLFAGGTGVSAFTAYLRGLPADHPLPVHVLYGARTPDLLIFRDEMDALMDRVAAADVTLVAETGAPVSRAGTARGPRCVAGRLAPDLVWDRLVDPSRAVFYLSGPPAMLSALTALLKDRGVDAMRIRVDAWE